MATWLERRRGHLKGGSGRGLGPPNSPPGRGGRNPGRGRRGGRGGGSGGGAAGADILIATTRVNAPTSTGNQDITISGLGWTPKAALLEICKATSDNTLTGNLVYGRGATDGTNQWAASIRAKDASATPNTDRIGTTDECIMLLNEGTSSVDAEANFVSFISNGIRINWGAVDGAESFLVTATFFGGADLSAAVGTTTGATSGGSVTVTPGFQTNALFSTMIARDFDDIVSPTLVICNGYVSYDGVTIRQCANLFYGNDNDPTEVRSFITDSGLGDSLTLGNEIQVSNITATQFDFDSVGQSFSDRQIGWLALNLGSGNAWAGVVDSPTTTGVHSFTEPGFTPIFAHMNATMLQSVDTLVDTGDGGSVSYATIEASNQFTNAFSNLDNSANSNTSSLSDNVPMHLLDDAGSQTFLASFTAFTASGLDLNFSVADGTARKWLALFIGK